MEQTWLKYSPDSETQRCWSDCADAQAGLHLCGSYAIKSGFLASRPHVNHRPADYSHRERSGSVVECLTRDRRAAGSSLTGVTALCPWARHINPSLVLVRPRKTRPCITERLLMGRKESNQTKQKIIHMKCQALFAKDNGGITKSVVCCGKCHFQKQATYLIFLDIFGNGPCRDKTCLWGLRQSKSQTNLLSHRG